MLPTNAQREPHTHVSGFFPYDRARHRRGHRDSARAERRQVFEGVLVHLDDFYLVVSERLQAGGMEDIGPHVWQIPIPSKSLRCRYPGRGVSFVGPFSEVAARHTCYRCAFG
jgi:hypothetical protein